jgi:hypothetical protein
MKTSWRILLGAAVLSLAFHASTRADEASHLQAARDVLAAAHMDQIYGKTIDQILDMQLRSSPQLADMREPMKQFFTKYMGWDALKDDMAKIYAQTFSEDELKQIAAFYRTPAGTKMIEAQPDLTREGMELGQSKVRDHLPELQEMLAKAKAAQADGGATGAGSAPAPAAAPAPSPAPAPAPTGKTTP